MAHLVYKKPLQNEKVRTKYIAECRELKDAKNHLDIETYKNAKKCMNDSFLLTPGLPEPTSRASVRSSSTSAKSIASSSSDSTPPTPVTKTRKGSIFDRGNVAARVFMADAQTEEQRRALKAEKKLRDQLKAAEELAALELAARGPFELPGSEPTSPDLGYGSTASSKSSKSSRPRLFSFKRNRAGSSDPTSPNMVIQEGVEFNLAPLSLPQPAIDFKPVLSRTSSNPSMGGSGSPTDVGLGLVSVPTGQSPLDLWPRSPPKSPSMGPSAIFGATAPSSPEIGPQRFVMSGAAPSTDGRSRKDSGSSIRYPQRPPTAEDDTKKTWADKYLLGGTRTTGSRATVDKAYARSIFQGGGLSRRHSFGSGESRHSFNSNESRRFSEAPGVLMQRNTVYSRRTSWATANELPYGLTNGYDENCYVPPSTMLLDLFVSHLEEFDSTPKLFDYARREAPRHFENSPEVSISDLHPGKPVILDPELESLKTLIKDRIWFLMTVKWQYFGRILFSPGHHLLQLGKAGYCSSRPNTAEELRVLDLDGPITADWSWHCALTYPDAQIHTLTTHPNPTLISPLTAPFQPPPNQCRHQITTLSDLSSLPASNFDLISTRHLARFIKKSGWHQVFTQCHRLLKHDGYMELTILDPVLNDMGPLTRRWILENVLHTEHPRTFDIMPTKSAIVALEKAGFGDINKNWLWVPVTSVGDEISTVTSEMGRWWYEELYAGGQKEERGKGKEVWERNGEDEEGVESPREHRTLGIWEEKEIMDECRERNSSFRWLKVWARKMEGVSGELPA